MVCCPKMHEAALILALLHGMGGDKDGRLTEIVYGSNPLCKWCGKPKVVPHLVCVETPDGVKAVEVKQDGDGR